MFQSIKHDDAQIVKDVIRMDMFCVIVFEQVDSDIKTIEFSSMDFKGHFPMKFLNLV